MGLGTTLVYRWLCPSTFGSREQSPTLHSEWGFNGLPDFTGRVLETLHGSGQKERKGWDQEVRGRPRVTVVWVVFNKLLCSKRRRNRRHRFSTIFIISLILHPKLQPVWTQVGPRTSGLGHRRHGEKSRDIYPYRYYPYWDIFTNFLVTSIVYTHELSKGQDNPRVYAYLRVRVHVRGPVVSERGGGRCRPSLLENL